MCNDTVCGAVFMTAEEYLSQAYKVAEQIKDKRERIANLEELMKSLLAIDYSKDKVQTSQQTDAPFVSQIAKIDELKEEINQSLAKLCDLQFEISHAIDAVEDVTCRLFLSKRYLLMKTMDEIADDMGYSTGHIYRIQEKALEIFKIPES